MPISVTRWTTAVYVDRSNSASNQPLNNLQKTHSDTDERQVPMSAGRRNLISWSLCHSVASLCTILAIISATGNLKAQEPLYASPNPIIVPSGTTLGATTLHVSAPDRAGHTLRIYVSAPPNATPNPGTLFAQGGSSFSATTGVWVSSGTTFFLWDATTSELIAGISVGLTTAPMTPSSDGCPFGPFTNCIDAVPATNLSTTWIDKGNGQAGSMSEWEVVANTATPGATGNVTGTVYVFPPTYPTCPQVKWTITGTYTPSAITSGTSAASTRFSWVASTPTPSATCGGYTPVQRMTYTGTIVNSTNDRGSGTWTNSSGTSGSFSIFGDPIYLPANEQISDATFGVGQASTVLNLVEELIDSQQQDPIDPDDRLFQGRQIFETLTAGASATDACWQASGGTAPFGSFTVQGTTWNVGSNGLDGANAYEDSVGWSLTQVLWYKQHLPQSALPCTARLGQTMNMLASNPTNPTSGQVVYYPYKSHTIAATINSSSVTITKDATSKTTAY